MGSPPQGAGAAPAGTAASLQDKGLRSDPGPSREPRPWRPPGLRASLLLPHHTSHTGCRGRRTRGPQGHRGSHGTALATTSKETRQRRLLYCDRCTRVRAGAQAATRHTPRLRRGHEHRATVTRVFFRRGRGHEGELGVIACFLFLVEHIPLGSKQLFNLLGRGVRVLSDNLRTQERCDRKAGRPNSHNECGTAPGYSARGALTPTSWNYVP